MPLLGLGSNWLQRAQATLARIQREEGTDSSSQGSGQARKWMRTQVLINHGPKC